MQTNTHHDITLTYTADVTVIFKGDTPYRLSDEEIERRFLSGALIDGTEHGIKSQLVADDVTVRDLKLFIHEGNDKEALMPEKGPEKCLTELS